MPTETIRLLLVHFAIALVFVFTGSNVLNAETDLDGTMPPAAQPSSMKASHASSPSNGLEKNSEAPETGPKENSGMRTQPDEQPDVPFAETGSDPSELGDMLQSFARMMFMLLVVLALAYLFLHKGLGKIVAKTHAGKRIQVIEKHGLDHRRSLYLVKVDEKEFLLGGSDGGVTPITALNDDAASKSPEEQIDFANRLVAVQGKSSLKGMPEAIRQVTATAIDDDGRPN